MRHLAPSSLMHHCATGVDFVVYYPHTHTHTHTRIRESVGGRVRRAVKWWQTVSGISTEAMNAFHW